MRENAPKKGKDSVKDFGLALLGKIPPRDWYEWRVQKWGTKWDISDVEVKKAPDHLLYDFDTAWSPPIAWTLSISKKYPKLTFQLEYEESGCDFEGRIVLKNGRTLEDVSGSFSKCVYYCGKTREECIKDPCEGRKEDEKDGA